MIISHFLSSRVTRRNSVWSGVAFPREKLRSVLLQKGGISRFYFRMLGRCAGPPTISSHVAITASCKTATRAQLSGLVKRSKLRTLSFQKNIGVLESGEIYFNMNFISIFTRVHISFQILQREQEVFHVYIYIYNTISTLYRQRFHNLKNLHLDVTSISQRFCFKTRYFIINRADFQESYKLMIAEVQRQVSRRVADIFSLNKSSRLTSADEAVTYRRDACFHLRDS